MVVETLHFWTAFIAGIFILLHIPSCDVHWANRLKWLSNALSEHHQFTLRAATLFAILHLTLSLVGLLTGVWI